MQVTVLNNSEHSTGGLEQQLDAVAKRSPTWIVMYGVEDSPFERILSILHRSCPQVPVFGATSFGGVFTSTGFLRNVCMLVGEASDGITAAVSLQQTGAARAHQCAVKACNDITAQLGQRPNLLLLHAIPGFEERILEGVGSVYAKNVPVFGGSAADDFGAPRCRVFANTSVVKEGFLLAGFASPRDLQGAFMGGFLPTEHVGTITKVTGRVVHEIDERPAAEVYNEWTKGAIAQQLATGGSVVTQTTLFPLSRVVGTALGMQRRILSHPRAVLLPSKALSFFSEFSPMEEVALMTGTADPLISRVHRTVERARGSQSRRPLGGLLVYCGGSLSTMRDQADRICQEYARAMGGAPFLGIATAGEQGAFFANSESWHGNLMCSTVLF